MDDTTPVPVLEEPPRQPTEQASNNRGNFTRNLNQEADESIARKMFFGGLLLLPWLHLVSVIFYRKQFMDPSIDPKVTLWVRRSFMGFLFMTTLFIAWAITFQLKWKDFGWAKIVMVVPPENLDVGW
ncbi:hypothetical protein Poli38472_001030 [Pythium oligandrum]|uniref:Gamma-secretase subunit PEN-2 n=1 Tax=Pythium oligandrum TaxID=41045 RepID=A0A8K1CSR0_PYTOL|nr:hypothetical protein Poli38472_001030 [Pythium oligandrum]|eukprot:TMW68874.1 hypothetical protein Poli38472_001030 [Pythium oligandrum]